jgi:hypothetical protein
VNEDGRFLYRQIPGRLARDGSRLVKKRLKRQEVIVHLPRDPLRARVELDWAAERGLTLIAAGSYRHGHFPQACVNGHLIEGPDDLFYRKDAARCRHCCRIREAKRRLYDRLWRQGPAA